MEDVSACLILFVRDPILGKVKTRLAAAIGEQQALNVYKILLEHTHSITAELKCTKYVFYSDKVNPVDVWDKGNFIKKVQSGNDLGDRMLNAFKSAFDAGHQKVVIIGSDCYDLGTEMILKAFKHLNEHDAVIGPAEDGGYYLLGLRTLIPAVFIGKTWSSDAVFRDTLKDIENGSFLYKILPVLNDVDVEEDLVRSNIPFSDN